ncbi:hypothetical protein HED60_17600 [Planctomycetales bacterium ZRK34]|nr:hypothetical protein HED60_17600 [Planctomycetales bacterium ZRK34]
MSVPLASSSVLILPHTPAERARSRRVMLLMAVLVVLGIGDLALTITHAFSIGMNEVNPVGSYLIRNNSVLGLTLFKLGSIGITVGLLLKVRHQRFAEAASWMLAAVMVTLTFHWYQYNLDLAHELASNNYAQVSQVMRVVVADVPTP